MSDLCQPPCTCKNTYWIDSSEQCPKCAGSCFDMQSHGPCAKCNGKGRIAIRVPCPVCNNAGAKPDKRTIIR